MGLIANIIIKMKISKIESATRQLDQAIELFFFNKDIISCLTLIWASRLILLDLAKLAWTHNWMQSIIIPEMIWTFENAMRKEQNFFKHAEKDGFADIEFEPKKIEWLLIDALNIYEQLPNCKHTKNMQSFQFYFIVNNPKLVNEGKRKILLEFLGNNGIPSKEFIWKAFEHCSVEGLI